MAQHHAGARPDFTHAYLVDRDGHREVHRVGGLKECLSCGQANDRRARQKDSYENPRRDRLLESQNADRDGHKQTQHGPEGTCDGQCVLLQQRWQPCQRATGIHYKQNKKPSHRWSVCKPLGQDFSDSEESRRHEQPHQIRYVTHHVVTRDVTRCTPQSRSGPTYMLDLRATGPRMHCRASASY